MVKSSMLPCETVFRRFSNVLEIDGAGEGIRTLDPNLGKKTDWLFPSAPDFD